MEVIVSRFKWATAQALVGLIALAQLIVFIPTRAAAVAANHVVISQIKTNSAGNASDEFIELYNPTDSSVFIGNWSVQYRGGGASSFDKLSLSNETLEPHGYYLIANISGTHASNDDQSYGNASMSLSATGATLFLVSNQTTLTTGSEGTIIDRVGYGTGTLFAETSAAIAPSAGNSIVRLPNTSAGNGTDTDNNSADFVGLSPANPRSMASNPQPFSQPQVVLTALATKVTADWNDVASAESYRVNMVAAATCGVASFNDAAATVITDNGDSTFTHDFAAIPDTTYAVQLKAVRGADVTSDCEVVTTPAMGAVNTSETAEIVYRKNSVAATKFGVGTIDVEVTIDNGVLSNDQKPLQATYRRPNSTPVTQYLVFDSADDVWRGSFAIAQGALDQDGTVTVTITTAESENVPVTVGGSFIADTHVATPIVAAVPVCGPGEDGLRITTDTDVTYVYVYGGSSVDVNQLSQNLVVAVPMVNGQADAMIGNNLYSTLYLVAIDSVGNVSALALATNDIQAPAQPSLNLSVSDNTIKAQWSPPTGATSFILRWKKATDTMWSEIPVAGASYNLKAENNVAYDVALASVDPFCNISAFSQGRITPHMLASYGVSMSDYESDLFAKSMTVGQAKDGAGSTSKSPYSITDDKDQNGILDKDEDKNNNGIKDGDETTTPSTNTEAKDNSRVIAIIAIILIILGAALAAYSWYKGEDKPVVKDTDKDKNDTDGGGTPPATESAAAPIEEKPAEPKQSSGENSKRKRGGKGGKRKTRW